MVPFHLEPSQTEQNVVLLVRMPRAHAGRCLWVAGWQSAAQPFRPIFRNPAGQPEIIGVSAGASFGGALVPARAWSRLARGRVPSASDSLALLESSSSITAGRGGAPILMVVLGGVVTASFFSALVALVTCICGPEYHLPAIVFWLLGSVSTAT